MKKPADLHLSPPVTANPGGGMVILAYATTIFISAFLLFQVQPLISKFILPWFGGSPAVWTTAMLFFQLVLFGGYLYAHLTSTFLGPRGQLVLHLALLAIAGVVTMATFISPSETMKPHGDEASPMLLILMLLGATVGLPYFVLSSTGPLLQRWFSDAFSGVSPYRLFALSNFGSLLALVSYPFFFEVQFDSRQQAVLWSFGFVVFAVCCAFCAWWTYRARLLTPVHRPVADVSADAADAPIPLWKWAAWIFLPALASVMFLATTNEVCQNVATVPLLWIIPLSLYLISFIVAFDHPRWYHRTAYAIATIPVLLLLANFGDFMDHLSTLLNAIGGYDEDNGFRLWRSMPLYCGVAFTGLFLVCMICHCELAALKPPPRRLTAFFLTMSAGGALGGIFCNLVAPYVFVTFFEFPLAMLAATAIAFVLLSFNVRASKLPQATPVVGLVGVAALLAIYYWQIGFPALPDPKANHQLVYRARNFYGLVSVQHRSRNEPEFSNFAFRSGHIVHGRQFADPARRKDTNIAYWGPGTGSRLAMEHVAKRPNCRIGIVGLGIGTLAGFAKEGDYVRMYEINPEVVKIAQERFYFLKDCPAKQDIVLGDARLQLERELRETGSHQFDVLCLDAFSGDAVPTHLLTTEAFALYKQHLKPDGIIVVNITNTYLDLYPVVTKLAETHGLKHTRVFTTPAPDTLTYRTYFVLLTNDESFLAATPESIAELPAGFKHSRDVPLWTDRYHNLFQVLQ